MADLPPPAAPTPTQLPPFEPTKPLPQPFQYHYNTGIIDLHHHLTTTLQSHPLLSSSINVATVIAMYTNKQRRDSCISATPTELKPNAEIGVTAASAAKQWPATGRIVGVVCSPMSNTVQLMNEDNWHMVGMAREGDTIFIYDTEFTPDDTILKKGALPRLPLGMTVVKFLIKEHMPKRIKSVWITRPSKKYEGGKLECMGRSMAWVQAVATGQIAWPAVGDDDWVEHRLT